MTLQTMTLKTFLKKNQLSDFFPEAYSSLDKVLKQYSPDRIGVLFFDGDLTITNMRDLSYDINMLIVTGNFTCADKVSIPGVASGVVALFVGGNLKCQKLILNCGEVVVQQNVIVDRYIMNEQPFFNRGYFKVKGEIFTSNIFKMDAVYPLQLHNHKSIKIKANEKAATFLATGENNELLLWTATEYYEYLTRTNRQIDG